DLIAMRRLVFAFLLLLLFAWIGIVSFVAYLIAKRPGDVSMVWLGYRVDVPMWLVLAALVAVALIAALPLPVAGLLLRSPGQPRSGAPRSSAAQGLPGAHPRHGRGGGRRCRRGAAAGQAGRQPAERSAAHPAAGGAGRPARRRREGRDALFPRHARPPGGLV